MPDGWYQGLGAFLAGGLTFLGAQFGLRLTKASSDKTIFVETVTHERAVWRTEMRKLVENLTSEVRRGAVSPAKPVDWKKVYKARTGIVVRLNPACRETGSIDEKHVPDRDLFAAVIALSSARHLPDPGWLAKADAVEEAAQRVLKKEWDKSKREARTGQLEV